MTTKTKNKLEKQIRGLELREFQANNDEMILEGYASVFDTPTVLWEYEGVEYKEIIDRHAFDNADFSDCCLKYNHVDTVPILARVRGGSLTTEIDDYGLKFRAKLIDTTTNKEIDHDNIHLIKGHVYEFSINKHDVPSGRVVVTVK